MGALTAARQAALLAALESCWLFALAVFLAQVGEGAAPPAAALYLAAFANLWFNLLPEPEGGSRLLLAGRLGAALLAVALLGLLPPRPEFVALALYLAWHARALAEVDVPEGRYRDSVFAGALGLAATLLARALAPPPALATAQAVAVIAFAVLAPGALLLAQRLQLMEEEDLAPSGAKSWAIGGGALIAGALATALLVLLVPGLAPLGLAGLQLLGRALGTALYFLLLPLAWLLFTLFYNPLLWLLQRIHISRMPRPQSPGADPALEQLRRQQETLNGLLSSWAHVALWLLLGLAALALLLTVGVGIRRRADPARRSRDQRRSVWRWSLFGDWLAGLLRQAAQAAPGLAGLRLPGRVAGPPRSARELYVDVQRRAAALGWARPPQQTALEHCALLARHLPTAATALETLAAGYGAERYGGTPPAQTLPALLPAWRQIVETCEARRTDGP